MRWIIFRIRIKDVDIGGRIMSKDVEQQWNHERKKQFWRKQEVVSRGLPTGKQIWLLERDYGLWQTRGKDGIRKTIFFAWNLRIKIRAFW